MWNKKPKINSTIPKTSNGKDALNKYLYLGIGKDGIINIMTKYFPKEEDLIPCSINLDLINKSNIPTIIIGIAIRSKKYYIYTPFHFLLK